MHKPCLISIAILSSASFGIAADQPLTFEEHVRPIFKAYCFECHGESDKPKASLDVRLKHLVEKGGESGPAIVPAKPDASLLLKKIKTGAMPPTTWAPRRSTPTR